MPEKKVRTAAKKVKDKWKSKSWYTILAPDMFNRMQVGETLTDDPVKLQGRITEATVQDLTGDFSKMHIKLLLKAHDVRGNEIFTQFVGHDMTSDYIRRLTRRKRTRTDSVIEVVTKDNWKVHVKPMVITDRRIQSAKQTAIRTIMDRTVKDTGTRGTIGDLVRVMISGELSKEIAQACKKVQPISRVEIRKSEVVTMGAIPEPSAEVPKPEGAPEGEVAAPPPPPPPPPETPPPPPEPAPEELIEEEEESKS